MCLCSAADHKIILNIVRRNADIFSVDGAVLAVFFLCISCMKEGDALGKTIFKAVPFYPEPD